MIKEAHKNKWVQRSQTQTPYGFNIKLTILKSLLNRMEDRLSQIFMIFLKTLKNFSFIAVKGKCLISLTLYILGNTNE